MSSEEQVDRTVERCQQQYITEAVQTIVGRRAPIEQTKGMLMFVYGIDADAAFNLLRWQSQQHNVKLRLIAELILEDRITHVAAGQFTAHGANQVWLTDITEHRTARSRSSRTRWWTTYGDRWAVSGRVVTTRRWSRSSRCCSATSWTGNGGRPGRN
jgi:hypothetical protein